jgi:hypothetical protein
MRKEKDPKDCISSPPRFPFVANSKTGVKFREIFQSGEGFYRSKRLKSTDLVDQQETEQVGVSLLLESTNYSGLDFCKFAQTLLAMAKILFSANHGHSYYHRTIRPYIVRLRY